MSRNVLTALGHQLFAFKRFQISNDKCDRRLAIVLVWPTENSGFAHTGMGIQNDFKFDGIKFCTFIVDHIVCPALEIKIPLTIDCRQITGIELTLTKGTLVGYGIVQIAAGKTGAPVAHISHFSGRQNHTVSVNNLRLDTLDHAAQGFWSSILISG